MQPRYLNHASDTRTDLMTHGIKEPLFSGFQWSVKGGGKHIRRVQIGDDTYELLIWKEAKQYAWMFNRI